MSSEQLKSPSSNGGKSTCLWLIKDSEDKISFSSQKCDVFDKEPNAYSPIFKADSERCDSSVDIDKLTNNLHSIVFIFSIDAYLLLSQIETKPELCDLGNVFFSIGLASVIVLNPDEKFLNLLFDFTHNQNDKNVIEYEQWILEKDKSCNSNRSYKVSSTVHLNSEYNLCDIDYENLKINRLDFEQQSSISCYLEQIQASLHALAKGYRKYCPSEIKTLYSVCNQTNTMFDEYLDLHSKLQNVADIDLQIDLIKTRNSRESKIVEFSAILSYCLAQGLSGSSPILNNRSPFPHHSLLGIGSAVKGLSAYIRHLENAFNSISISSIFSAHYSYVSEIDERFPILPISHDPKVIEEESLLDNLYSEHRDAYGQSKSIPLLSYFSLRQGFKESSLSVSAASECLSLETRPQWTLSTLSHEVMHSRVRHIEGMIFKDFIQDGSYIKGYQDWVTGISEATIIKRLQYCIVYFCLGWGAIHNELDGKIITEDRTINVIAKQTKGKNPNNFLKKYRNDFGHVAIELLVHYHDLKYVYGIKNLAFYTESIMLSWGKVNRPYTVPEEYLVRLLVIAATGATFENKKVDEFQKALQILKDSISNLQSKNYNSIFLFKINDFIKLLEKHKDFDDLEAIDQALISKVKFLFNLGRLMLKTLSPYINSQIILNSLQEGDDFEQEIKYGSFGQKETYINPVGFCIRSQKNFLEQGKDSIELRDDSWYSAWNFLVLSSQLGKI